MSIQNLDNNELNNQIEKFILENYSHIQNKEILQSIQNEKKNEIIEAIKNKSIENVDDNINEYLQLPIYKIAYQNFKNIIDIKEEKKNKLQNVSYSNAYKCYKCGSNKTSVVYLQTRSCDEPMTAFIKCVKCQNQFIN